MNMKRNKINKYRNLRESYYDYSSNPLMRGFKEAEAINEKQRLELEKEINDEFRGLASLNTVVKNYNNSVDEKYQVKYLCASFAQQCGYDWDESFYLYIYDNENTRNYKKYEIPINNADVNITYYGWGYCNDKYCEDVDPVVEYDDVYTEEFLNSDDLSYVCDYVPCFLMDIENNDYTASNILRRDILIVGSPKEIVKKTSLETILETPVPKDTLFVPMTGDLGLEFIDNTFGKLVDKNYNNSIRGENWIFFDYDGPKYINKIQNELEDVLNIAKQLSTNN